MPSKFKFFRVCLMIPYYAVWLGRLLPLSATMERGSGGEGVIHITTLFLLRQKPLHLTASHVPRAGSHDGLTVDAVLAVTAGEDTLHIGGR